MRKPSNVPPPIHVNLHSKPVINVVTAYEDFATGQRAIETYSNLVLRLGHEFQFRTNMWKFEVLQQPKLLEMAVQDALDAQIIIVSTHGESELPQPVQDWIQMWASRRDGDACALVALFDCVTPARLEVRSIRSHLSRIALAGQMDFFSQPPECAADLDSGMNGEAPDAARRLTSIDGLLAEEMASSRWRIDE